MRAKKLLQTRLNHGSWDIVVLSQLFNLSMRTAGADFGSSAIADMNTHERARADIAHEQARADISGDEQIRVDMGGYARRHQGQKYHS